MKKIIVSAFVLCSCIMNAQDNSGIEPKLEQKQKVKRVDKWFAVDKAQHFTYSCLISLGCQYVLVNKSKNTESESLPVSTALSFVAGLSSKNTHICEEFTPPGMKKPCKKQEKNAKKRAKKHEKHMESK